MSAVVVEFGRRIERGAGSVCLLVLTLLIAVPGNVAQFLVKSAPLFGGLSGVAYGLFAYVVVRGRFDAAPEWRVHPSFSIGVRRHSRADEQRRDRSCSGCTSRTPCIGSGWRWGQSAAAVWRPTRPGRPMQFEIVETLGSGVLRSMRLHAEHAGRLRAGSSMMRSSP